MNSQNANISVEENARRSNLLHQLLSRGYGSGATDLCHADFESNSVKALFRALGNLDSDFANEIKDDNGKVKAISRWNAAELKGALKTLLKKHDGCSFIFLSAAQTESYRLNPSMLLKKKLHPNFPEYVFAPVAEPDAAKAMENELKDVLANPPKALGKRTSSEANLSDPEEDQPAPKKKGVAALDDEDEIRLMRMIKTVVDGSIDGMLTKAGLPELRSDVAKVTERVDKIECEFNLARENNFNVINRSAATEAKVESLSSKVSKGLEGLERKIEEVAKGQPVLDSEDIRTAALTYIANKSRGLHSAAERRRRGLFKIVASDEKFQTRSDAGVESEVGPNMVAIRRLVKEEFKVIENGIHVRQGENGKTLLTVCCELTGRGYKSDRMIKLMRNKKEKYGGALGISYMHDGGINFEDTWRDWKQQGLINGFGYSGSGVDQLRTTENAFVLIISPDAVSKLKRSFVTHDNLSRIHANTHFVADGYIYEFPNGLQRPRAGPLYTQPYGNNEHHGRENQSVQGSTSLNDATTSSLRPKNPVEISRINPYANARPKKGGGLISGQSGFWNGSSSYPSSSAKSSSGRNNNVPVDIIELEDDNIHKVTDHFETY